MFPIRHTIMCSYLLYVPSFKNSQGSSDGFLVAPRATKMQHDDNVSIKQPFRRKSKGHDTER
jgi:hypothetical protein